MHLEEKYCFNKDELASHTFDTLDLAHPGVAMVKSFGESFLGGEIDLINSPQGLYDQYKLEQEYCSKRKAGKPS